MTRIVFAPTTPGFDLKFAPRRDPRDDGHDVLDHGTDSTATVDYPPICAAVGRSVRDGAAEVGIVVGGSGQGEQLSANKVRGVRAALCNDLFTARLARAHNDANVLSIGAWVVGTGLAEEILATFLTTEFEGERYARRVAQIEPSKPSSDPIARPWRSIMPFPSDTEPDTEVEGLIQRELERQVNGVQLIASENFTSPAVMRAVGSVLTNKYSEGYPGKRYYGGNQIIDDIEALAIERAKSLFGAEHANVQPHSGANANMCVYQALMEPGDTAVGLSLDHGGHLTHGARVNASAQYYRFVQYGIAPGDERIDFDQVRDLALEHRPKVIVAGTTAYPRRLEAEPFRAIADEVGAVLVFDIAHLAGLVAGGAHPSPVGIADVVTLTTHKSLRGPRGGCILSTAEHAAAIDKAVFPGWQGGPLEHVIAGKAVAFREAAHPSFKEYAHQIVSNASALAEALAGEGFRLVSGGTDNHLMVVDLRPFDAELTGKVAQLTLDEAGITLNKNTVPDDPRSPFVTSGLRIGTPSVTTQGMEETQMPVIAELIAARPALP